ncbi:hypothetical protein Ccrd_025420, partial [Cynara cardunculus var. scolymus]
VDLLGDEVETLLGLLEKIYIALDHYSPVLQHYPGVLREGNLGYGILVSSAPKESKVFLSLRDTSEVRDFLKALVKWKEHVDYKN